MNGHAPSKKGSHFNHHAHLLLTTRTFDDRGEGSAEAKDRRFDGIAMQRAGERNAVDEIECGDRQ